MTKRFIVATAGHVDHGKSALVKALTGTDPDRLPEEKARGITIDLGFAHLELGSEGDGGGTLFALGMVDVPGHEDFVRNMVAGVGAIDLALLVVAADDGWMPQTEEHLQILSYLGVTRGVVALTKADLLEGDRGAMTASVRERLAGSPLAEAPIVPACALTGEGIEELKAELIRVLERAPLPVDVGKPRLAVDRVFTLRGIGTVVTGTLTGGVLRKGQAVVLQPGGTESRVRGVESHNAEVAEAGPGTRTALNLADVAVGVRGKDSAGDAGVKRGDIVTLKTLGAACSTVDVMIWKTARLAGASGGAALPLKEGMRVRVHRGSGNWPGRIHLLDRKQVGAGEEGVAEIRFDSPVFVLSGDRFVIRDWSGQHTVGGGVVLDAEAERKRFRSLKQRRFLAVRSAPGAGVRHYLSSLLERDGIVRYPGMLLRSVFAWEEIVAGLEGLQAERQAVVLGDWVADMGWWRDVWGVAVAAIDGAHRDHPERAGLELNPLRAVMKPLLPEAGLFDVLLVSLCAAGFVQCGTVVRREGHRPRLPPSLEAAGARLRGALAAKPYEPPSRKELAPDANSQQALRFLRESGEAIELGAEVVVTAEAFGQMRALVVEQIRVNGPSTVSDLRQRLGTSRRIMMPLLDRLDREGITVRQEDSTRVLGRNAAGL